MDATKNKQGSYLYFLFWWMLILLEGENVIEFWEKEVLLSCSVFQSIPVESWVEGFFFNKWFGVDDECLILWANIWKLGLVELSYNFLNSEAFFRKSFLCELKLFEFIFQLSLILLIFVHNLIQQSQCSGFIILEDGRYVDQPVGRIEKSIVDDKSKRFLHFLLRMGIYYFLGLEAYA